MGRSILLWLFGVPIPIIILSLSCGTTMAQAKAEAVRVPEQSVESSASAVEWAAIIGGALGAVGISIILFTLGSGLVFRPCHRGRGRIRRQQRLERSPGFG